jgi:hypothetical protein
MPVDLEKKKICDAINHAFKPHPADEPAPDFKTCTFCGASVEVVVQPQTEYRKAADVGVKLPEPKAFTLTLAPESFAELKQHAEAAGQWLGDGFTRVYAPEGPIARMFDAWVIVKYPQVKNHLGPVKVVINWMVKDKAKAVQKS